MLQARATSEANATRFIERAKRARQVWGLASQAGEWAFCPSHEVKDAQVLVFWSDRALAARQAKDEWREYEPTLISLDLFTGKFLQVMQDGGLLVGPNWDAHLCGLELKPLELARRLEADGKANSETQPAAPGRKAPP